MLTINPKLNKYQKDAANKFMSRFERLASHPKYPELERFAQKCIDDITDSSAAVAAMADVHMNIINEMSKSEFRQWAENYSEEDTPCMKT